MEKLFFFIFSFCHPPNNNSSSIKRFSLFRFVFASTLYNIEFMVKTIYMLKRKGRKKKITHGFQDCVAAGVSNNGIALYTVHIYTKMYAFCSCEK